ncbi:menaquinone-dependent protoporphyrinogen IX dehydrogenase [Zooshikella harenae]|uniref:Protoporphyrinogen IX dehydrogenase [quinone] n=1 Tax=Zooshikella harenae TaxID=2827238 RepID=A0ABS5ZF15_9GAMM|nr:menaquinone-dependent protoporphyrinogen IX dehydrogenase [Zooshikella harenae]MBU2712656.1 menaquinone-dependent protoporphyrinogen IX dehydrogenase [Zooshikella harenae]
MKPVLLLYYSHDGQTEKIMQFIAQQISCQLPVSTVELTNRDESINLAGYSAVLIAGGVRYGGHPKALTTWINKHSHLLTTKPTGLISVNLTARKPNRNQIDSNPYIKKWLLELNLRPDTVAVFAGALQYSKYSFLDKLLVKLIMKMTEGPTDTRQDYEFTNWQQIEEFSKNFSDLIVSQV